jgi:hypothetical protein
MAETESIGREGLRPFQDPEKRCLCRHTYQQHRHFDCGSEHAKHRDASNWQDTACFATVHRTGAFCRCAVFRSKAPDIDWYPKIKSPGFVDVPDILPARKRRR